MFKNKTILLTGGTGSFGHAMTVALLKLNPKKILIFSRDEFKQYTMQNSFKKYISKLRFFIGDVRDSKRLNMAMKNVDFVIQTPTSVASVKGTDFWMITDPVDGDVVIGLDGVVTLTNNETGAEVDVTEGTSGSSTPDGDVDVDETEESSIPEDPTDQDEQQAEIKIYFEGPNGEQKVMIIEYQ